MIRHLTAFFISAAVCINLFSATSTISDSIDIQHITIHLDVTDYGSQTVNGYAAVKIKAKVDNISYIPLDLLELTVDSVKNELGNTLSYSHSGELLSVVFPAVLNTDDSTTIYVYYKGEPAQDGSWGGWYWSGDYSFQLGVGFDAIPHNYGRVWFPCFDNFVERQTFRCEIITTNDKKAFCGGLLESAIDNGDGTTTWNWNLNQEIPSYLASVSVSTYSTVNMVYDGIIENIPIQLAVKAEDSTDLKNSFIHLNDALSIFENHYGPYLWDRVGYSIVPFGGGAMEHAMNIAYPLFAVTGTTAWEDLMVHELSHNWWGNLITCSTPEEMWLNEGWAVYSEHLFKEQLYGEVEYAGIVKSNHLDVLRNAAFQDGQNYFAISGVPQSYTYGYTTYRKGADVIHTLRGYMGDDLFFDCITGFLDEYQFQSVSAAQLRDYLSDCSGFDMNPFFDGWVYQPGFPAFEIEDLGYTDVGNYITSVCIQQKLHHADTYCTNVPLTITFFDESWNQVYEKQIVMSGEQMMVDLTGEPFPLGPRIIIDYNEKINDAVTEDEITIFEPGNFELENALIDIEVNTLTDSVYLYAQHYWVGADGFKTPVEGLHINSQRYWKLSGYLPAGLEATAELLYNGQLVSGGFLDNEFISNDDDSLVLLYRSSGYTDWEIYPYYTLNIWGNSTDKRGAFQLSKIELGEYAFGIYDHSIPTAPAETYFNCPDDLGVNDSKMNPVKIYPNPTNDLMTIQTDLAADPFRMQLVNAAGDTVIIREITNTITTFNTSTLPAGIYQLYVENRGLQVIASEKVIVIH